jgi:tetratricopeptide (TPR) repeat protein
MIHTQWFDTLKYTLDQLVEAYPQSSENEQKKWKQRLHKVKSSCDWVLEQWIVLEEQIAQLMQAYPELLEEEPEKEETFYLDARAVRAFREGQGYYQLTMFEEAERLFQDVLDQEPDFLLGQLYLGLTSFQKQNYTLADRYFQIVCEKEKHEELIGFAWHMLGCSAVQQGDDHRAVTCFQNAIKILSDHHDSWFNLGACYYRSQRYREAIPHFYQAVRLNEDDWEAMEYLSHCHRFLREWSSVSYWRFAALKKQNHPRVIASIAHDFEEMGQPQAALEWYHRLLSMDRKSPVAYHGLAWNYWQLGEKENARLWLKKGLTLFPKERGLLLLSMWMLLLDGEKEKWERFANLLPQDEQEMPLWIAFRSRLLLHMGDLDSAIQLTDTLVEQEDSMIRALGHYQKGRILLDNRSANEAVKHFQQAHQLMQHWKDPLFYIGVCYLLLGQPEQADHCWQQIALQES